jgi:IclR family pca regulon transcriptional regulator
MPAENQPPANTFVDTFARGLAVLEAFGPDRQALSLSEVAEAADISRAAARRLLLTLCHLGYATQNGRTFQLTARVMRLGYAYLSSLPLAEIVEPYVLKVAEKTGESCSVCVLDGHEVVYVTRASTRRVMSLTLAVGTRLPAWATANGRVLLGELEPAERASRLKQSGISKLTPFSLHTVAKVEAAIQQAKRDGYSFVNQELELGLTALAMPLFDQTGRMVAAINIAGHAERNPESRMLKEHLPVLRETVRQLNAALGSRRAPAD